MDTLEYTQPLEQNEKPHNPWEGVDIFDQIDAEPRQSVEEGVPGTKEYTYTDYYPRTGQLRSYHPKPGQNTLVYESRKGLQFYERNHTPEKIAAIQEKIDLLASRGIEVAPASGYVEVETIVDTAMQEVYEERRDIVLISDMKPGTAYINVNDMSGMPVFRFKSYGVRQWADGARKQHTTVDLWKEPDPALSTSGSLVIRTDYQNRLSVGKPILQSNRIQMIDTIGETPQFTDEKVAFLPLSEAEVQVIAAFQPPQVDFIREKGYTREDYSTQVTIHALQYERWGKDAFGEREPGRYNPVTTEKYQAALRTIVERFGPEVFEKNVITIFDKHLQKLHLPQQRPDDPHSDGEPLDEFPMKLATQVISDTHPLPTTMHEGPQVFVVNEKSLFGDEAFWSFVQTEQPLVYQKLIAYWLSLSTEYLQQHTRTIDPPALIKQYFPKAYEIIKKDLLPARPDLATYDKNAVTPLEEKRST